MNIKVNMRAFFACALCTIFSAESFFFSGNNGFNGFMGGAGTGAIIGGLAGGGRGAGYGALAGGLLGGMIGSSKDAQNRRSRAYYNNYDDYDEERDYYDDGYQEEVAPVTRNNRRVIYRSGNRPSRTRNRS